MATQIKLSKKELQYLEEQKHTKDLSLGKYNRINILLLLNKGEKSKEIEDFFAILFSSNLVLAISDYPKT
ncbi:MAG: hypothetical protein QM640_05300 [Niabella sp.]